MIAPIQRLKKADIVWLGTHRCKHKHTYLEHYNCYLEEQQKDQKRIGFLDIETTGLEADWDEMLCWCIYDQPRLAMRSEIVTPKEMQSPDGDKRVVKALVEALKDYDLIITYYGSRFDVPFARTRAMVHGIPFPLYGTIKHRDIYFIVRNKFKLSRNRLDNACRVLLGDTDKTRLDGKIWRAARKGKLDALGYVLDHCQKDVLELAKLYHRIIDMGYPALRSI